MRGRTAGTSVWFAPDALGRATGIVVGGAGYVHGVANHPNGLVQSGSFGDGQAFSQSLTDRQWPWVLTTARSVGPAVMQRSHADEVPGKVASITDAFDPAANRGFAYDGKGRVSVLNGSWGGSVVYDALDSIRRQTLGGRANVDRLPFRAAAAATHRRCHR